MTIRELKEKLKDAGIPEKAYSLEGGVWNEKYCLDEIHGMWQVYYCERGVKNDLRTFDSETDACGYFFSNIKNSFNIL